MENLKVIRTSKQESLTREVELFKDENNLPKITLILKDLFSKRQI